MILNNVITNKTQRNGPAMLVSVELIIMLMDAVHGFIPYGRFPFIAHKRFSGNSFFLLCLFEAAYSFVNSETSPICCGFMSDKELAKIRSNFLQVCYRRGIL